MHKKKLPLEILKALEKFVTLKGEQFDVIDPGNFLIKVKDKDKNSDFYFYVEQFKQESGFKLLIDVKPKDAQIVTNYRTWINTNELQNFFNNWVLLLKEYDKVKSFYDDPIVQSFADEYYAEFKIIDPNAEIEPFNPTQILLLDKHLESLEKNITKYQNELNKDQLKEIKEEILDLRDNLTSKSKVWIIKKLSFIWAKITKQGTKLMKELLSEAKKQIVKEGVKMLIETGIEYIK